jgi:hypothetical protein
MGVYGGICRVTRPGAAPALWGELFPSPLSGARTPEHLPCAIPEFGYRRFLVLRNWLSWSHNEVRTCADNLDLIRNSCLPNQ